MRMQGTAGPAGMARARATGMTPLTTPIRRSILIEGEPYTLILDATGVRVAPRGARRTLDRSWSQILQDARAASRDARGTAAADGGPDPDGATPMPDDGIATAS